MAWYVFALVDAVPAGRTGNGLTGALSFRKLAGGYVVVERRADVPPVEFGSLRKHQEVVDRLAARVPAILPVRFGTLLEPAHLEEALEERDDEIADAFDLVRGRVQFTWRVRRSRKPEAGSRKPEAGSRKPEAGSSQDSPVVGQPASGTAYLRQAALAANPPPSAVFRALRATLFPLVAGQRYQPPADGIPEAVYHLVEKTRADRYATAGAAVSAANPVLVMSGPFPPFAFAPEIL